MNKKNRIKYQKVALFGTIGVLLLGLGIAVNVQGNLSFVDKIANRAGEILGMNISDKIQGNINLEESFGATQQDKWTKVGNRVTYIESGQALDANVVLFSILNPFTGGTATSTSDEAYNVATHYTGTSTVASLNLDIVGASTSTMQIICGAADTSTALPTYEMANLTLPTSTTGVLENNMATTTSGYAFAVGSGSQNKIIVTHGYPFFNCVATGTPDTIEYWGSTAKNGVIGGNNTFNAYYSVEFRKNVQ